MSTLSGKVLRRPLDPVYKCARKIDMQYTYQILGVRLVPDLNPNYSHISQVQCRYIDSFTRLPLVGMFDRQYIAQQILSRQATAFVSVSGYTATVQVETWADGRLFLRTHSDNTRLDNLLSLPRV
jgi:hypothetical protein